MIGFVGKRGSGKTYHMTELLNKYKKKGYFILSNYSTVFSDYEIKDFEDFKYVCKTIYFATFYRKKPINKTTGIVIAIDESGALFNSRDFGNFPKWLTSFIMQARKINCIIIHTTQHPMFVDVVLRRFTETWFVYSKVFGSIYRYTETELDSETPNFNEAISSSFPKFNFFRSKNFDNYNTYQIILNERIELKEIITENEINNSNLVKQIENSKKPN